MLESVLNSMAEGLVAVDESGKFMIWNQAARKIVGYGPADLSTEEWSAHYGQYMPDGTTPLPAEQNPLARAMRGEACTEEIFLRNPMVPGGVWIEASASPLRDAGGLARGGVVAFRDITQRRATSAKSANSTTNWKSGSRSEPSSCKRPTRNWRRFPIPCRTTCARRCGRWTAFRRRC